MHELSKEYLLLFNAITDAENTLVQLHAELIATQQKAEELYIQRENSECYQVRQIG